MSEKDHGNRRLLDQILKGLNQGNLWQTRYMLTPKHGLNNETVGGIWDVKIKSKTNKAIIRFENGFGRDPHINIDVTRFRSEKNLRIPVSENIIRAAEILNNTLHHVGSALFFASIALDAYRLGSSLKEDFQKRREAVDSLKSLNGLLKEKREVMKETESMGDDLENIVLYYENLQKDIQLRGKVPCETIKTGSIIIFSWVGGSGGAVGGGWIGGIAGGAVGDLCGSYGATLGAFVGTIFGSFAGGICGGIKGCEVGETVGNAVLRRIYDKKYKDDCCINEIKE